MKCNPRYKSKFQIKEVVDDSRDGGIFLKMPKGNIAMVAAWEQGGPPKSDDDEVAINVSTKDGEFVANIIDSVKFRNADKVLDAWIADGCPEGDVQDRYRKFVTPEAEVCSPAQG